jgi:hypothetical protein
VSRLFCSMLYRTNSFFSLCCSLSSLFCCCPAFYAPSIASAAFCLALPLSFIPQLLTDVQLFCSLHCLSCLLSSHPDHLLASAAHSCPLSNLICPLHCLSCFLSSPPPHLLSSAAHSCPASSALGSAAFCLALLLAFLSQMLTAIQSLLLYSLPQLLSV